MKHFSLTWEEQGRLYRTRIRAIIRLLLLVGDEKRQKKRDLPI